MNNTIPLSQAIESQALNAFNLHDFLNLDIQPQENILAPIIKSQSLSMLFAKRGIGKTHVALGIGYAIASGGSFLQWKAPNPHRVLYIDGEMSAYSMQERLAQIVQGEDATVTPEYFKILTPDMQEMGMPDISTQEGQEKLEPFIRDAEFIIVDNISTLARTGKENEAESWLPVQSWALNLRSRGKSILFVHHAGKSGQQRGSSRREDVLDMVMELRHPSDYQSDQGARFEVHFTKARHLIGKEAEAFEAKLFDGQWSHLRIEDAEIKKVLDLQADGLSIREIADETGISKSRVQRILKR